MDGLALIKQSIRQEPFFECEDGLLYCADCMDILPQLPEGCVDLVLTDPPYNASNAKIGFGEKKYSTIDEEWDKGFKIDFVDACWKGISATGSMIAFCSYHTLPQYLSWKQPRQILHWVKTNPFPAIAKVYTPNVEYACWFTKGSPYIFNKAMAGQNILVSSICCGKERGSHPTQKPLSIMSKILMVHSNSGNLIFDPFLGSGTTAVACKRLGRKFIGIEISEEYCSIAKSRIQAEQKGISVKELKQGQKVLF